MLFTGTMTPNTQGKRYVLKPEFYSELPEFEPFVAYEPEYFVLDRIVLANGQIYFKNRFEEVSNVMAY